MPKPNSARREDLEEAFHQGHTSQNPGPVGKLSSFSDDQHDNMTPGAGILIRRIKRPADKRSR